MRAPRILAVVVVVGLAACGPRDRLRALAAEPAPCTTAADCCVVVDGCEATAYVVGAAAYDEARRLSAQLDEPGPFDACVDCIPPSVELACVDGACVGAEVDPAAGLGEHCGAAPADGADAGAPADDGDRVLGCSVDG